MKKICLSKLQFLLLALLLTALTGCGANNAGIANNAGDGVAKAALVYGTKGTAKTAAALVAVPTNVASVQFTVTGSGPNGALPVVKNVVNAAGGSVTGIYPGTVTLAARAFDSTGAVVFEGFARNAVITAGTTTDVGTIMMTAPTVKAAEAGCLGCHDNTLDETGQNIVGGYKQSGHYSNTSFKDISSAVKPYFNKVGTGCVGCHGPQHNVGNPSDFGTGRSGAAVTSVGSARCFDCHNANAGNVSNHDTYYVANGTTCTACHQVHDTAAANMERLTWADSRHGATDFAHISGGGNGCATRCHNAKGFIAAVANPTAIIGGTMNPSDQMITCDACHTDAANGKLRALPGTKATAFATYTSSTPGYGFAPMQVLNPNKKAFYPDVAGSNLCIVCHSGTTEGSLTGLGMSDPYFAGSTAAMTYLKNGVVTPKTTLTPHNMPAAAVMYVKFGFTNLSTGAGTVAGAAYLKSLTSDLDLAGGITSTHRKFGTSAIITDSHFSASNPAPANFLTNGPCAVCHVAGSHSYKIDQAAISAVCNKCHSSENGNAITSIAAFQQFFLEPQQEVYNTAIQLGQAVLNKKVADYNATPAGIAVPLQFGVGYDLATSAQPMKLVFYKTLKVPATPYNVDGTLNANSAVLADFQNAAKALGYSTNGAADQTDLGFQKFMGAISNLAFLAKDQGGFAHARTYSRRLIYDSIDFLDDARLNMSVGTTAMAISPLATVGGYANPVFGKYVKAAKAYADNGVVVNGKYGIGIPYGTTSESMLFLLGWNRSGSNSDSGNILTGDTNAVVGDDHVNGSGSWTVNERP